MQMAQDAEKLAAQAERLRHLKSQARGLTNGKIANEVGVTERQVQRWMARRNTSDIDPENLKKLARFLGTTPDYIEYGGRNRRQTNGPTPALLEPGTDSARLSAIEDRLERIERQLELLVGVSTEAVGVDLPPTDVVYGTTGSGKTAGLVQVIGSVRRDLDELLTYRREAQEQLRGFDVEEARDLLNLVQEVQARQGREVGRREIQSRAATGR